MKIIDKQHQIGYFHLPEQYTNIYNTFLNNSIKISILKPDNLTPYWLETNPVRVVFYRIKNFEIILELEIKWQAQLLELFKILSKLNIPKNAVNTMLSLILTNWKQDIKNKDITLVKNNLSPEHILKAIYNEETLENYGQYSKTTI